MVDRLTPAARSRLMSKIRSRNTSPEMSVRRTAHALGYRFRLHKKSLPGTPDLVFSGRKAVIFVNGCYWHGHGCSRGGTGAKSNQSYWAPKIERTRERDRLARQALAEAGWRVLTVWECETGDAGRLRARIDGFLSGGADA